MSTHGTISLWTTDHSFRYSSLAKVMKPADSLLAPSAVADDCPPGFRHFLRNPQDSQKFTIDGKRFDPDSKSQRDRADRLMTKLVNIIKVEPVTPAPDFNTDIPSGYTYLLQFMAHDMVASSLFLSRNQDGVLGLSNVRNKPLRLETLFGGGPIQCPYAYEADGCDFRDRLRLGQVRADGQPYSQDTGDFRDIPRARATDVLAEQRYPEALIGDPRNDSHAILSQLVVMMHHFQRKVLDKIKANENIASTNSAIVDAQRNFVAAQAACALIYRRIIRNDVLRRILHRDVYAAYETRSVPIVSPPQLDNGQWLMPVEFSFGFFRFGHSMIRSKYSFNSKTPQQPYGGLHLADILQHTSEKSPDEMPFENIWTIDWSRFFGSDPDTTNFSVKIGPWSRIYLENTVRGTDSREPGLTIRDLTSSIAAQPWSVRALAQELTTTHGSLLQRSPFLNGDLTNPTNPPWFAAISEWLDKRRNQPGECLDDHDIKTLAADPPIPFLARFEAGVDPQVEGRRLGVLTSIIVADVLYSIFRDDQLLGVDSNLDLAGQLKGVADVAFGVSDAFAGLDSITTMNDLINFLGPLIQFPAGG